MPQALNDVIGRSVEIGRVKNRELNIGKKEEIAIRAESLEKIFLFYVLSFIVETLINVNQGKSQMAALNNP